MDKRVSITACKDYEYKNVRNALEELLVFSGYLDFVKKGDTVAIKANLVTAMKPDTAAVTHPVIISALSDMLYERGAKVIVGDSPGGPFNQAYLSTVYAVSGMNEVKNHHAVLNDDFSVRAVNFQKAKLLKNFEYTAYLDKADYIIDCCKLKSHGMMGFSGAAKNMFGVIPGMTKPEYHFRFPSHEDFADMLIDIDEYFAEKIKLCITDAVVAMEGNGPTQGKPKYIGAVEASCNPHAVDLLGAKLIGLEKDNLPMLKAAYERNLIPASAEELEITGDYEKFITRDFESISTLSGILFEGKKNSKAGKMLSKFYGRVLRSEPRLKNAKCVGCNVCGKICPAKAITIDNKKAKIDRSKCIRCFCCQEFCPKGAMVVHKTLIAKLITKKGTKK